MTQTNADLEAKFVRDLENFISTEIERRLSHYLEKAKGIDWTKKMQTVTAANIKMYRKINDAMRELALSDPTNIFKSAAIAVVHLREALSIARSVYQPDETAQPEQAKESQP